jgi:hypothetical protein
MRGTLFFPIKNSKYAERNTHVDYLFSSMIKCGLCDRGFGAFYNKKSKGKRYSCYNTRRRIAKKPCSASGFVEYKIDIPIWDKIVEFLENPDIAFKQLEKIQSKKNNIDEIKENK